MNNVQTESIAVTHDSYTAFQNFTRLASGTLIEVSSAAKVALEDSPYARLLVFSDDTGETVELDLRGTMKTILPSTPASPPSPGPGRPRLGVVAREVTLLPRHWDWLNQQPGGASVALRRLVEDAKRANAAKDRVRRSQEVCYRFMSTIGGDLPGFEEAARALFAANRDRFETMTANWPTDIRNYSLKLGDHAFENDGGTDLEPTAV